ncbi:DUF4147 domain-containing protein [Patescibacteria group bacterium]|nr:DUF4147 domain-containing protein [Patescibacteria group bacterium]
MEGKIKNSGLLSSTPLREAALKIVESGLEAIDTEKSLKSRLSFERGILNVDGNDFDLNKFESVSVIGVGKCAFEAGGALQDILGGRLSGGIVLVPGDPSKFKIQDSKLRIFFGTHPFPTEANVDATQEIIRFLSSLTEEDFVIFVISGGGSTLLCQPPGASQGEFLKCEEEGEVLKVLFEKGATIQEINTVRKHLSLARGGHLAAYSYPASSVSLIFSDVPGDSLEFIASGPTVKDETTVDEAKSIIAKYDLEVITGFKINPMKTPKEDKYFEKVKNILFVSNETALSAMKKEAEDLGFKADIVSRELKGEAREVGIKIAEDIEKSGGKQVLIYGGETTVTIKGSGRGGRNEELVLAALKKIGDDSLILSLDSDGHDNQGGYAGAICDIMTKEKTERIGLKPEEFLNNNDSAGFFEREGDYLETGDTGSNVSDLVIALKK